MPVLVRWKHGDGSPVTIRCTEVREHPLLPDHLHLVGVRGANDPDHEDLVVVALAVRVSEIQYMCDTVPAKAAKPEATTTQQAPQQPPEASRGDAPTLEPPTTAQSAPEASNAPQGRSRPRPR